MSWWKELRWFLFNDVPEFWKEAIRTVADTAVRTWSELASWAGQFVNRVWAAWLWAWDKAVDLWENIIDFAVWTDLADKEDTGYKNAQKFLDKNMQDIQEGNKELKALSREHVWWDFSKTEWGNMAVDVAANIASFLVPMGQAWKVVKVADAIKWSKAMGTISQIWSLIKNPIKSKEFAKEIAEAITKNGGRINEKTILEIGAKYKEWAINAGKLLVKDMGTAKKNERLAKILDKLTDAEKSSFFSRNPKLAAIYNVGKTAVKITAPVAYGASEAVDDLPPSDNLEEAMKIGEEESKTIESETPSEKAPDTQEENKDTRRWVDEDTLSKENPNLNVKSSLVDTLKALNINSAMEARKALYENLTWKPYQWTADQNIMLRDKVMDLGPEEIQKLLQSTTTL